MITNFADLCTYLYVLTDEAYQEVAAPYDTRPGPDATCTDSELITLTLAAELVGMAAETRFLAYVRRNHRALFPLLPERSRYNRRRRQLIEVTNRPATPLWRACGGCWWPRGTTAVWSTACRCRSSAITTRRVTTAGGSDARNLRP